MGKHILCLNSGSSSIKFALYELESGENLVVKGAIERIGMAGSWLWLQDARGKRLMDRIQEFPTHGAAVKTLFTSVMEDNHLPRPDGVGHRVVHGGPDHTGHEVVTPDLILTLRRLIPFAPLHLPPEILGIDAVSMQFPELGQVVCFDTAFHRSIPEVARRFPLPRSLWHEGVYRYGFHGLSYEYVVHKLGDSVAGRHVVAHLGNGASMAALRDGRSVDTTMGFTPTAGLMMGTRSGDLDPGLLVYLIEEKGYDAGQLSKLLNHRSGLIGVSGISPDMKTLLEKRNTDGHAAMAVEMFCYYARKAVGGLAAVLGGLDGMVFTGGIGERAAPVRELICDGLGHLGINLDPERNTAHADVISTDDSPCPVRIIPTNEDLVIARHTRFLLFGKSSPS
ncbi:MAG: acetate/propionate family kinase [Deltaproteobacteria bacterium]|nr:acetate/propionate family kinase [Deltaproteobacteria bacterium]